MKDILMKDVNISKNNAIFAHYIYNVLRMKRILYLVALLPSFVYAQNYQLSSPDGKISVSVHAGTGQNTSWSVAYEGQTVLTPSGLSMKLQDGTILGGKDAKVTSQKSKAVKMAWPTPFYKKSSVDDVFKQLVLTFKGDYSIEFRAYNDGVAYRFITKKKNPFTVKDEVAEFKFADNYQAFVPYVNDNRDGERYTYSFESYYDEQKLQDMFTDSLAITPLLVDAKQVKVAVSDFGTEDYPGMFLVKDGVNGLKAVFAPVPLEGKNGGYNDINFIATKRADYIAADVKGSRTFPWRALIIAKEDKELANNDMVQRLSPKCRLTDTSWIKPGKVAWDWWNNMQISGVDFKAGQNTETYKYYIDFAAKNNIEYIIIDEGWSDRFSLMIQSDKMNVKEIVEYGKTKNVGVILWTSWDNVHRAMNEAFPLYAEMGVKGFKVDFFDADDQNMMRDMYLFAETAAKYHLLLDYHGMKANGVHVAYPNVVNFEGVKGLENYRWAPIGADGLAKDDAPRYAVTIPFIRTLVGPMDYTPGAMRNATKWSYTTNGVNPMSQGTRVHQLAMYTMYEAPLQMMADSPTSYMKNKECADFIAKIPTVFEETVVIDGKVGEYIVMARRNGNTWYVSAMTNWTERDLTIDFSFLPQGSFNADVFQDGVNADREATDYKHLSQSVTNSTKLSVHLAPAGGWAAIVK